MTVTTIHCSTNPPSPFGLMLSKIPSMLLPTLHRMLFTVTNMTAMAKPDDSDLLPL